MIWLMLVVVVLGVFLSIDGKLNVDKDGYIKPRIMITGPGVIHVRSSEILRSRMGYKQLKLLKNVKVKS